MAEQEEIRRGGRQYVGAIERGFALILLGAAL
jgi:hypothetical protein